MLLPKPVSVYRGIEVYRCLADGLLMTDAIARTGIHGGHRCAQPVYLTLKEKILIWLKIIR